jgi:hypothetical protein
MLGAGWDSGCADKPELWGTERANPIVDLTGVENVVVACLEITDHSGCVDFHTGGLACKRDGPPYGDWSPRGIYAQDARNIELRDLDVHGLAETGIHAGRLTDWTVENVRIAANGMAGWDGDLPEGDSSNSGTLTFRRVSIEWNGCGETWPGNEPTGCWAQTAGGYGDGLGTDATQGRWVFEECAFSYNTSDGLDLLYAREGSAIEIRRTIARGNAGNQIKTNGPTVVENSIVVGNCGYFEGKPFTFHVDNCRAAGNALSLDLRRGDQVTLTNNTIASEGDCLVLAECFGNCSGSESVVMRNNIFQGYADFLQPSQRTCLVYQETFPSSPFDMDYSVIHHVKHDACPGPNNICGVPPGLTNADLDAFDAHLTAGSPAIDAGTTEGAPADDFEGRNRDARPDIGAYEWRSSGLTTAVETKGKQ